MLRTPSTRKSSTVGSPLAFLLIVLVGGRVEAADGGGTLRLATCQFPVSADVKDNGNGSAPRCARRPTRGPT